VILDSLLQFSFLFLVLRAASPILIAAMGAVFTERASVPNIGIEGMMLLSAFFSVLATIGTGSAWVGLAAGVLSAVLAAVVMGFFAIDLRADIIVTGFAINILGAGLTVFLLSVLFGQKGTLRETGMATLPSVDLLVIGSVPGLSAALSGHNVLVYLGWLLVVLTGVVLYRTPVGLRLRAVGEDADAARSVGISVRRYQYLALILGGACAGLAGANLSIGYLSSFVRDMTAGRGFIALAAVLFGGKTPVGTLLAALLFGLAQGVGNQLQSLRLPSQVVLMIPYLMTVVALVGYRARQCRRQAAALRQGTEA
jgi:simple sugar transport system permease protein